MSKLVDGNIPAGTACPFIEECKFKVHTCPGSDNGVKAGDFSCAAARLHNLLSKHDNKIAAALVVKAPKKD